MTTYEWANLAVTSAGIVVGIFVLIVYSKQLTQMRLATNASKRSADTARDALLATQRAFVRLDKFICTPVEKNGIRMGFTIALDWKNSGLTPAINALAGSGIRKLKSEDSDEFDMSDFSTTDQVKTGRASYGPGGGISSRPLMVPMEDVLAIGTSRLKLFVYGRVHYHDVFDGTPEHHTADCAMLELFWDRFKTDNPFQYNLHPRKHNYAD